MSSDEVLAIIFISKLPIILNIRNTSEYSAEDSDNSFFSFLTKADYSIIGFLKLLPMSASDIFFLVFVVNPVAQPVSWVNPKKRSTHSVKL